MEQLDRDTDGSSLNIVATNIDKLKTLFPDIFSEGKIDFDKLRESLGDTLETQEERYNFTWNGKAQARRIAQTPSTGTLRPCKEESKNWDATQNLFIEGDNLEVLKLLQKSYHKQVKMIYIDPPYNTGKEFIYPDNFKDNLDTYLQYTNQKDSEGRKFGTNADTSGRYHTNWLNMMCPRLKLARNLLKDNGFLIVSIDDAESKNLQYLLSEVFGEENHIATLVWDKNRKNDAKFFSVGHEYMHIYAKNKQFLISEGIVLREQKIGIKEAYALFEEFKKKYDGDLSLVQDAWRKHFNNIPNDRPEKKLGRYSKISCKGPFRDDGNISWPGGGGPKYEILHPETKVPCKVPDGGWRYSKAETFWNEVAEGKVVFGPDETTLPRQCRYLFEGDGQVMTSVHYSYAQTAAVEFLELMGKRVFENPKNWRDIYRLIGYLTAKENDVILDFFSGSATTAHAVMALNAKDNGGRKFIMAQLPEPCDEKSEAFKAGYKTIADIGKERIRRAGEKILQDNTDNDNIENLDIGFKVFKLDSSNIKPWDADFDNLEDTLLNIVDNIKGDRSEDDVLYEILLKYGLDLTVPIEERQINSKTVHSIGFGALVICLDDAINLDVVEGIGRLKEELDPEVMRVVFKDSGFQDDVVKTNAIQILKKYNITDVKSL